LRSIYLIEKISFLCCFDLFAT